LLLSLVDLHLVRGMFVVLCVVRLVVIFGLPLPNIMLLRLVGLHLARRGSVVLCAVNPWCVFAAGLPVVGLGCFFGFCVG
jgi:hypothetical protein